MESLGTRLVRLLAGDLVRLETAELELTAEVLTNEQTGRIGAASGATGRHVVRFMPIGEDATRVAADRYHVSVDPLEGSGWVVGPLVAEVFDESSLAYESQRRGELQELELLESPA